MPSDARAAQGRRRRALRLLASDPLPPPPETGSLLASAAARRPGEFHEPLALAPELSRWLSCEATQRQVDTDVLGSVLLEAGLVSRDLGLPRFLALVPPSPSSAHRSLSAAEAAYLRALTIGSPRERGRPLTPPATIAVPLRVGIRVGCAGAGAALKAVPSELALAWERAGLLEGRTLTECVLLEVVGTES